MWAILRAQAQTRTQILGTGTAFDAQKQFLANVEDAISSPVDLPSAINRYQDVLQYAGSKVNFVFGIGLYMAPGDMLLHIGQVVGYNNKIIIATLDQKLGENTSINTSDALPVRRCRNNKNMRMTKQHLLWAELWLVYWRFGCFSDFITSDCHVAYRSRPTAATKGAHICSANQPAVFARRLSSHEAIEPGGQHREGSTCFAG